MTYINLHTYENGKMPFAKETMRLLQKQYTSLKNNDNHIFMMANWIRWNATRSDTDTGLPFFGCREIKHIYKLTRNISTNRLLYRFQADVLPDMEWSHSTYNPEERKGKCRQILDPGINIAYYLKPNDEIIDIRARKAITTRERERNYRDAKAEAQTYADQWRYPDQKMIADYTLSLPYSPYLACLDRFNEVRNLTIEQGYQKWQEADSKQKRSHAYCSTLLLDKIFFCPVPFYQPSSLNKGLCPRLFGAELQELPKRFRKLLYPDWKDLDLQNCHVSIIAGLYGCNELKAFIASGCSLWQELGSFFDLDLQDGVKKAFKKATFSICYGMAPAKAQLKLEQDLLKEHICFTGKLMDCPKIKLLYQAVLDAKKKIKQDGGVRDAYGSFIKLSECKSMNSLLTIMIQSYELALIAPIYDYANQCKESHRKHCDIWLYSYDGVSVSGDTDIADLQKVVRAKGKDLKIDARLDVE